MKKLVARVLAIAILAGGLTAIGTAARADAICTDLALRQPVGARSVCVPLP